MKINYCDALVIGGGLAGLRAAVAAQKKGLSTTVLSLVPVKRSHSAAAQGGMQASLGNSKMSDGDNEDLHFADTVKGSDWGGCDQEVARMFVHTAPKAIRELAGWGGVPWSRVKAGVRDAVINAKKTTITEDEDRHGLITSRDFGGTKKNGEHVIQQMQQDIQCYLVLQMKLLNMMLTLEIEKKHYH